MKRKLLLRRNTLYGLILAWAMLMVSPYVSGAPPGSAPGSQTKAAKQAQREKTHEQNAAARKQEQRKELTTKYGMTMDQIRQYEALQAIRHKKVMEIKKTSGLSQQERRKKIKAVT